MRTDGHSSGKNAASDTSPAMQPEHIDADHPGYETSDVNVTGIAMFLAGLFGTVILFFFFCYAMGGAINALWQKQDGPASKWEIVAGAILPGGKGKNLASNPEIEQKQLQQIAAGFSEPRLEIDDGEQETADLHAREDLLLEHYSLVDGQPGTIRIPIERAMQLIAQSGLPVANQPATAADSVAHAAQPEIQAPLTTGFARTGFELTTIEERQQKMDYGRAETPAHTDGTPAK